VWRRLTLQVRAVFARGPVRADHMRLLQGRGWQTFGKMSVALAVVVSVGAIAVAALWWRLGSGPVAINVATPWLTAALEEKFGRGHRVEVGGTLLERSEDGRTAIRLRDIVVRDADGGIIAKAPKAEIGIGVSALFTGQIRAERLKLIGAEMSVRIDHQGKVAVFAAPGEERPITSIAAAVPPTPALPKPASGELPGELAADGNTAAGLLSALVTWLQSLDAAGLDGRDLAEVGLQSGTLTVDDVRSGRRLTFENIHLNVARLKQGGAAVAVASTGADGPWAFNAVVAPRADGSRTVEAVIQDVSPKDVMLALRMASNGFQADVPVSAMVQAELAKDGSVRMLRGRVLAGAGRIGDVNDPSASILIDELKAELHWEPGQRALHIPIEIQAGPNKFNLLGRVHAMDPEGSRWSISVLQGLIVLASLDRRQEPPLVLDRISMRAQFDAASGRLELEQFDLRGNGGGIVMSGALESRDDVPQLMLGVAASPMGALALKRLWPAFVAPELRQWVNRHVDDGEIERLVIATKIPLSALQRGAPPLTRDALSVELVAKGAVLRPIDGLPAIREANLIANITGRNATVTVDRGIVDLPSGRRLTLSGGLFEVLDLASEPILTRTSFRVESGVDGVAELLDLGPLRGASAMPGDLAGARGNVSARVVLSVPLLKEIRDADVGYSIDGEIANFVAENALGAHKAEASSLRVSATPKGVHIRGDVRIGGAPANLDYRLPPNSPEVEIRLTATLDEAARTRLGLDFGGALAGPVPVKLSGRKNIHGGPQSEGRFAIEADLTPARVDELMPGWSKPAGRPARLSFTMVEREGARRLEDFVLEGSGASARGAIELDARGELVLANLTTFAVSDGDKASLRAERGNDGVMRITLRGDVYDGRGLVKGTVAGQRGDQRGHRAPDLDIDIRLGAMTGYHGEALRGLEVRLSRRNGQIRTFAMNGRIGRDARIRGDLRSRGGGRQVLYLETNDAGALFRFTDIYPRIFGGSMSMAMDPPVLNDSPREGLLNVRDFEVRGEPTLERVASSGGAPGDPVIGRGSPGHGVAFSRLRAEFTRSPGRFSIREGVVWGPAIGATVDGSIDYQRDEVRMRGTFVPAYGLNNMFSRLPVLGLFLGGGENEGLLGVTFQVVGSPRAPLLQVNMMSAVAPGILRKLFEFRGNENYTGQVPERMQ
jgi:hypothetical protein